MKNVMNSLSNFRRTLATLILMLCLSIAFSQGLLQVNDGTYPKENQEVERKHFIGSSLFVTFNFLEDSPSFYQLNYGYRFSEKSTLIIEAITWKYSGPLGIPYGDSYESPQENFPGYVRDFGLGLAYQRFLYKGFYSTVHATPFVQQYFNAEDEKIQTGFQLFLTLRFGYHFKLFNNRFFIEPSVCFTHWPVNTNLPDSFQKMEDQWPNYFLFEPGLQFGIKF